MAPSPSSTITQDTPTTYACKACWIVDIYQTIHDGALAFLVVVTPSSAASEKVSDSPESPALTRRRSPVRIRPSLSCFRKLLIPKPSVCPLSFARIMTKKLQAPIVSVF